MTQPAATVYGQPIPLQRADLLSALSTQLTARSGGPPSPGSTVQDDEDGQLIWSQLLGEYLYTETDEQLVTENNEVLITES